MRRAAAGAGASDAAGVHLRAGDEIIQRSDAVPDHQPLGALADQQAQRARVVADVLALPEPKHVDQQHDIAAPRKRDASRLDSRLEAAVRPVTVRTKYPRERS